MTAKTALRHGTAAIVVVLFALGVLPGPAVAQVPEPAIVDDFDETFVSIHIWREAEFVRQITGGNVESVLRQLGAAVNNSMSPVNQIVNPTGVMSIQADVTVIDALAFGPPGFFPSRAKARVGAALYNDGTGGGGSAGDVQAELSIRFNGTVLLDLFKCTNADCSQLVELTSSNTRFGPVALGTPHTLLLAWDGINKLVTFGFDGDLTSCNPTTTTAANSCSAAAAAPVAGPAAQPFKLIGTRIGQISGPNDFGFIAATFDNVFLDGALYDDFPGPFIDRTKWSTLEFVRRNFGGGEGGGRFESALTRFGLNGSNSLNLRQPLAARRIEADVTVTAVDSVSASPRARLFGSFYNDGTPGPGRSGDILAGIEISLQPAGLVGSFFLSRCLNDACNVSGTEFQSLLFDSTTFGPAPLGTTHHLSLEFDGVRLTYGFDGQTVTIDPTTFAPFTGQAKLANKGFGTRFDQLDGPNEGGFIRAIFDNFKASGLHAGEALDFDGIDDFVSIPDTGALDFDTTFTVEAWVKPASFTGGGAFKAIAQGAATPPPFTAHGWALFQEGPDYSNWGLTVCTPACNAATSGPGGLQVGQWQHVAGVYDGANIRIYRNGDLVATTPWTGNVADVNFLIIGRWVESFHGRIDEVRLWNVARSQAEIAAAMSQSLSGNEAGLVDYWRFDEGPGQTVFDSARLSSDGTLGSAGGADEQDPVRVASDAPFSNPAFEDRDGDGVPDATDNCPSTYNPDQADRDEDGVGDACDNCKQTFNPGQEDGDLDDIGDACEGVYEQALVVPDTPVQPGTSLVVEAVFTNTSGAPILTLRPDCFNTAFSVRLMGPGGPTGDFLPPSYKHRTSYGPEDVVTLPPGEFRVRCDLFGDTGTSYDPSILTSGPGGAPLEYEVLATHANNIGELGGQVLSKIVATSSPVVVTLQGPPVTERRDATVVFVLPVWLAGWANKIPGLPIGAVISHVAGHHVRDIDPGTIRLNGTVPIIPKSAIVLKDVLFVAFNAKQAVQSLGTVTPGATVFPAITGGFRRTPEEAFAGQGKVLILKLR